MFGGANDNIDLYQEIFTCQLGNLPMKYLGMLVSHIRIRNKHLKGVEDKTEKSGGCWQGNLLGSITGRIIPV